MANALANHRTATVIFDGDCGLCASFVSWAAIGNLRFKPYQSFSKRDLTSIGLTTDQCSRAVQIIVDGRRYEGAAAINRIVAMKCRLARCLLILEEVSPLFLLESIIYTFVAKHRVSISKWLGFSTCRVDDTA